MKGRIGLESIESTVSTFHWGDVLFQLGMLAVIFAIAFLIFKSIIGFVRSRRH